MNKYISYLVDINQEYITRNLIDSADSLHAVLHYLSSLYGFFSREMLFLIEQGKLLILNLNNTVDYDKIYPYIFNINVRLRLWVLYVQTTIYFKKIFKI